MELSIVRADGSLRLLIPKILATELGWEAGDVLEFAPRGTVIELRSLGKSRMSEVPFRRRLRRFGGSYAVTIPREVRKHFAAGSVKAWVEGDKLVVRVIRKGGEG